ncbi:MAG: hypothetical protein AABZ57_04290, partial [Candidatus Margulisiibacteriota bacterium]
AIRDKKWAQMVIKMWVCNFYLMMPGPNGFRDSTFGGFMSMDRYVWRASWRTWELMKQTLDFLRKNEVSDEELIKEIETNLGKKAAGALGGAVRAIREGKTFWDYAKDLGNYVKERSPDKGLVWSALDWVGDQDKVSSWMMKMMTSRAGEISRGTASVIWSPLTVGYNYLAEKGNENNFAHGLKAVIDASFKYTTEWANPLNLWRKGFRKLS